MNVCLVCEVMEVVYRDLYIERDIYSDRDYGGLRKADHADEYTL